MRRKSPSDAQASLRDKIRRVALYLTPFTLFAVVNEYFLFTNPALNNWAWNSYGIRRTGTSSAVRVGSVTFVAMLWFSVSTSAYILHLFNGIPGPLLARLTVLWKLFHVRKGTYAERIRTLHSKYGAIVRVGPYEYSVSGRGFFRGCSRLEKASLLRPSFHSFDPQVFGSLRSALDMANIFRYEPDIERCNEALIEALVDCARSGQDVDIAELIAKYAYDTLFATTIGQRPGFLNRPIEVSKLTEAIENWKFWSTMYGSYLRFHPIIVKLLRLMGFGKGLELQLSKHLLKSVGGSSYCVLDHMRQGSSGQPDLPQHVLEACLAIMLAGSDPVVTHLLTTLSFIYQDPTLVESLRTEFAEAQIGKCPKFKDLIHAKPRMPLLHAVLRESLRLSQPRMTGLQYISPQEGIFLGDKHVTGDCTICLEPSIVHTNPNIFGYDSEVFNPQRWLNDPAQARFLRRHMLAFGAGTDHCPGQDLHTAIISKLLIQIVTNFDINMNTVHESAVRATAGKAIFTSNIKIPKDIKAILIQSPLSATAPEFKLGGRYYILASDAKEFVANIIDHDSEASSATSATNSTSGSPVLSTVSTVKSTITTTLVTWADTEKLEELLGRELTNELLTRFDPCQELTPREMLKTSPIIAPRDRYAVHEIIGRVWGGRLIHETESKSQCMYIWVQGSKVPVWLTKLHELRQRRERRSNKAVSQNTSEVEEPKTSKAFIFNTKLPAFRQASAIAAGPRTIIGNWGTFAGHEKALYANEPADVYIAQRDAAFAKAEACEATSGKAHYFTQKYTHTQTCKEITKENIKETPVPVESGILPPHLRAKLAAAATTDTKDAAESTIWVAAKLPSPISSH